MLDDYRDEEISIHEVERIYDLKERCNMEALTLRSPACRELKRYIARQVGFRKIDER